MRTQRVGQRNRERSSKSTYRKTTKKKRGGQGDYIATTQNLKQGKNRTIKPKTTGLLKTRYGRGVKITGSKGENAINRSLKKELEYNKRKSQKDFKS